MQYIAPLLQTVLWVGLLGVALWRFEARILGLLTALEKRIDSGSNIKAGPFELTQHLKPQDSLMQREKMTLEVSGILQEQEPEQSQRRPESYSQKAIQARYLLAEDLALRAIQAEYGVAVSRQVTAGRDMGFDGAFISNGRLNIIEVKYFSRPSSSLLHALTTVDHIVASISRYGWGSVQIILAVVVDNADDVVKVRTRLQERIEQKKYSIEVVMRCDALTELQQRFGVEGTA